MLDYTVLIKKAKECGFIEAGPLDASTLEFLPEVRAMCADNRCHAYGTNWACPPACGTLEEMRGKVKGYQRGLLVQTVGQLEDSMDWDNMQKAEKAHEESFQKLWAELESQYPHLLAMGAGTCTRCEECAYSKGKPCRFPSRLKYSMEAFGLLVSKVCVDNGLKYNYGKNTVAFTGCFLLK